MSIIKHLGTDLCMGLTWVHISLLPVSYPCFDIKKNPIRTQTQSKRRKLAKLKGVRANTHRYKFCCHS